MVMDRGLTHQLCEYNIQIRFIIVMRFCFFLQIKCYRDFGYLCVDKKVKKYILSIMQLTWIFLQFSTKWNSYSMLTYINL